jgi:exosortase A
MSAGQAALLLPPRRPLAPRSHLRSAAWPYRCAAVALLLVLVVHFATAGAIVGVWLRSATFAHGFMIPPIALWLVWRQRERLAAVPCRPSPLALLALGATGALWLLSTVANVQVVQQYCLIPMLAATVAAVLGRVFALAVAFPLAYLLLAVPFGEVFVPPLIDFTARFIVAMLQLAAIPVFHENSHISLPTGNWSVVEACSGLRYLIASLALGTLYAYLTYRSLWRRLAFIVVALALPVFANGLRACLIVLIGHWSDMTLAIGVDHLVYGWVFFGLVMTLMFWCGAHWRQYEPEAAPAVGNAVLHHPAASPAAFVGVTVAAIAVAAIWPLLAMLALGPASAAAPSDGAPEPQLTLAPPPAPWRASPLGATDWRALHQGQPQHFSSNYHNGRRTVSLQLTWYRHQTRDAELLAPVRRLAPGQAQWSESGVAQRELVVGGRGITVRQSTEQSADAKLLVWRWYRLPGGDTSSPHRIKLMLAKAKLLGGDDSGAEIVVASTYDEQAAPAQAAMRDMLAAMLPVIDQGLRHVATR